MRTVLLLALVAAAYAREIGGEDAALSLKVPELTAEFALVRAHRVG
jgi:hypothetical protein